MSSKLATLVTSSLVLMALAFPAGAAADPVTVTGYFNFHRQDDAAVELKAPDLIVSGQLGDAESGGYDPPYFCGGESCTGRTFNLSASDSLGRVPDEGAYTVVKGSFTLGGSEYWFDRFTYIIRAGDIVAPADTWVSTWFRFSATAAGTSRAGESQTLQLIGAGTARSYWHGHDGWLATEYRFEDPAAVPEPVSMVLMGTGLVGIAGARRRAAKQRVLSR